MKNPNKTIAFTLITLLHFSKIVINVLVNSSIWGRIYCNVFESPTMEYNKQFIRHCLIPSGSFRKRFLSDKRGKLSIYFLIKEGLCLNNCDTVDIALSFNSGLFEFKYTFNILNR